jgi:SH3 domain-containing YSC84-like protein 1
MAGQNIVVSASSSGAFAGVSLQGSVIKPRYAEDRAYYGPSVTQRDILFGGTVAKPGAGPLVLALDALG